MSMAEILTFPPRHVCSLGRRCTTTSRMWNCSGSVHTSNALAPLYVSQRFWYTGFKTHMQPSRTTGGKCNSTLVRSRTGFQILISHCHFSTIVKRLSNYGSLVDLAQLNVRNPWQRYSLVLSWDRHEQERSGIVSDLERSDLYSPAWSSIILPFPACSSEIEWRCLEVTTQPLSRGSTSTRCRGDAIPS